MVSFVCNACEDVMTKPKIKGHVNRCHYASFTCVDCNTHFAQNEEAFSHNQCITEAQKWHGKFANGNQASSTPNPKNTAKSPSKERETPKSKKRTREDDGDAESEKSAKKARIADTVNLNSFKWKKALRKELRKADKNKMKIEALKEKVVDKYLESIRSLAEEKCMLELQDDSKIKSKKKTARLNAD